MEKRYQVFISSTFQDLQGARQEVSQALLRADCFPAGMELFPAADEEQFEFIKTVIDQSDYYILISAGRYGSIHPVTGLSFTEMEYDYAVETGKPVIRLLHKDPKQLADESDDKLAKLMSFRAKLKNARMNAFWSNPDQLGKEVAYALMELKKTKPAIGWVRADRVSTIESELEIEQLKRQLAQLKLQAFSVSDIEQSIKSFSEKVSISVEASRQVVRDGEELFGKYEIVGLDSHEYSLGHLMELVAIGCHHEKSESDLFTSFAVQQFSEYLSANNEGLEFDVANIIDEDSRKMMGVLYKLESLGVLQKRTERRKNSSIFTLTKDEIEITFWQVTEKARPWTSGMFADNLLGIVPTKTPPQSAP